MSHEYFVYFFKSSKNKQVIIDGVEYSFDIDDVYYVGEGNENRLKNMYRNIDCNYLTEELEGRIEVIHSNISKEEAIALEKQYIEKLSESQYLSNKTMGNKMVFNKERTPEIKFLIELDRKGIIDIAPQDLAAETRTPRSSFYKIQDTDEYISCIPKPPKNLLHILTKYKPKEVEDQLILGELKYCLRLINEGLLKMSLKELCEFYNVYHEVVKKARDEHNFERRPPEKTLESLFSQFGFHILSDKEINDGRILSCINLKEKFDLQKSDAELAGILKVHISRFADVKRSDKSLLKPIELSPEELGQILAGEYFYMVTENVPTRHEKFAWDAPSQTKEAV